MKGGIFIKWSYESPIGTIIIVINANGQFSIIIKGTKYGGYQSAVAAADDVYTFSTGCYEWDKHCADIDYQLHVPTSIHEWERIG